MFALCFACLTAESLSFSASSTPGERLSQIRRRKKRMHDDTFSEIMNTSGTVEMELRAWRISLSEKLGIDMGSRRASQEQERSTQDEMLQIMKHQSDTLRHLGEHQEKHLEARFPLQPLQNCPQASPCSQSPSHKRTRSWERGEFNIPSTQHWWRVPTTEGGHSKTTDGQDYCAFTD